MYAMSKRWIGVIAVVLLALAPCSCETQEQPQEAKQEQEQEQPQDPSEQEGDEGGDEETQSSTLSMEGLRKIDVDTSTDDGGHGRKKVSLLGDSITTYQGYTPYPNNYQYPKSAYTDFTGVDKTWWYRLIYEKMQDAELEVNSSYTGTCVQNTTDKGHPGDGFLQRYVELGNPDVILINGGTNDSWSYKLPVGNLHFSLLTNLPRLTTC